MRRWRRLFGNTPPISLRAEKGVVRYHRYVAVASNGVGRESGQFCGEGQGVDLAASQLNSKEFLE